MLQIVKFWIVISLIKHYYKFDNKIERLLIERGTRRRRSVGIYWNEEAEAQRRHLLYKSWKLSSIMWHSKEYWTY